MKKIITPAALALTALFGASAATAEGWFVGGQVGKAQMDYDLTGPLGGKYSGDEKSTEIGIRAGKMYDNVRLMGSFTYNEYHSDEKQKQYLFSADYFFGEGKLRPFVGATAGINHYKFGYLSESDSSFAYGGQAGVRYQLSKNLSLEGAVQHLRHDNEVHYFGSKIESDRTNKAFIALDYAF